MKPTDKALATSRQFLDGTICLCGHTEGEHLMFTDPPRCFEKRCRCKEFRPVRFKVQVERVQ